MSIYAIRLKMRAMRDRAIKLRDEGRVALAAELISIARHIEDELPEGQWLP